MHLRSLVSYLATATGWFSCSLPAPREPHTNSGAAVALTSSRSGESRTALRNTNTRTHNAPALHGRIVILKIYIN